MSGGILYLNEREALACAPSTRKAIDLAARALRAISAGLALLSHQVLRPHPDCGFSSITGTVIAPGLELAGQKWVSEAPDSSGVTAIILLNNARNGELLAVMGARGLTGLRTAAVSGACMEALAPAGPVAIVGTGLQCRHHLEVLAELGHNEVRVAHRRLSSGEAIAGWAAAHTPSIKVTLCESIRTAVQDAGTVLTMVTRGSSTGHIEAGWLRPDALLLPVDFAHCIDGATATDATLLATDDPANYEEARAHGELPGYPEARLATGAALDLGPVNGRIVIQNLGNAAADLLIASEVRSNALALGAGTQLAR